MRPKAVEDIRIGVTDAARLLNVKVSVLKAALESGQKVDGAEPPQPIYRAGSGGLVFRMGDVMRVADSISKG